VLQPFFFILFSSFSGVAADQVFPGVEAFFSRAADMSANKGGMRHDKRFKSAEDALRWLIAARDTAGTVGSVTGRCVADGELGLTPDGDVFGPSAENRIHTRCDLEMVIDDIVQGNTPTG
jgi:hypothetical protein